MNHESRDAIYNQSLVNNYHIVKIKVHGELFPQIRTRL